MKTYDYQAALAMRPCWLTERRGRLKLRSACARLGGAFTVQDVLNATWLHPEERLWFATRHDVVDVDVLRQFAVRISRRALERERTDGIEHPDLWHALEVTERYHRGEATVDDLAIQMAALQAVQDLADSVAMEARAAMFGREFRTAALVAIVRTMVASATEGGEASTQAARAVIAWAWTVAMLASRPMTTARMEATRQIVDLLELLADLDGGTEC